jgi:hypothetical protein
VSTPALWTDPRWIAIGFSMSEPHRYAYQFVSDSGGFTARANGDLDGDSIHSTFERSASLREGKVVGDRGLHIDNELE